MKIFAIEDETAMLSELHQSIQEACPEAEIHDFRFAAEALKTITDSGIIPDIVFSDIELPGMNGLDLAVRIKQLAPMTKIIFVTGYSQYALEAYRQHVNGYVLKPAEAEQIREQLDNIQPAATTAKAKGMLEVRCFGNFEVFWQGQPLLFERRQTKEMLAYLIDREGAACTAEEIISALWEDEPDLSAAKNRLRQLVNDMKKTLSGIGMEEVLIRRSGQIAIRRDLVDCDYFRMLDGDVQALNTFNGEYMKQYSWAEMTTGRLFYRKKL